MCWKGFIANQPGVGECMGQGQNEMVKWHMRIKFIGCVRNGEQLLNLFFVLLCFVRKMSHPNTVHYGLSFFSVL